MLMFAKDQISTIKDAHKYVSKQQKKKKKEAAALRYPYTEGHRKYETLVKHKKRRIVYHSKSELV